MFAADHYGPTWPVINYFHTSDDVEAAGAMFDFVLLR